MTKVERRIRSFWGVGWWWTGLLYSDGSTNRPILSFLAASKMSVTRPHEVGPLRLLDGPDANVCARAND